MTKRPWHMWFVAIVVLFLYANGAVDFLKTMSADAEYLRAQGFAPGAHAYFVDYPIPLMLLFAVNILAALGAAILLLRRSVWTVKLAVTSAAAMLVLDVYTYVFRGRWEALGEFVGWFDLFLLTVTLLFAAYAIWCRHRGLLPSTPVSDPRPVD